MVSTKVGAMELARRHYRGWRVVIGSFICSMLSIGATHYSYGLFVVPVSQELNLSRADANSGLIAMSIGSALLGPIAGRMLDRWPVRAIMAAGGLLLAFGLITISFSHSPWMIVLAAVGPIAFAADCAGGIAGNTVTARWFRRRRGRAFGIIAVAASAGGFAVSPLAGYLIEAHGWRSALAILGGGAGLLIVLISMLLIRSRPSETELRQAGEIDALIGEEKKQVEQRVWTYPQLLTNRNFLLIVIGAGLLLASDRAILVSVAPYLADTGVSIQMAAFMLSALTGSAMIGKLSIGFLAEYFDIRKLYLLVAGLHVALLVLFIVHPGYWILMAAAIVVGAGLGGVLPVCNLLMVSHFGSASYGSLMGLAGVFIQAFSIAALRIIGETRDRTDSYDLGFQMFIAVVLVSALLIWLIRPAEALRQPGRTLPAAATK